MVFDLKKVIVAEDDSLRAFVPFREGIEIEIRYISRASLMRLSQSCMKMDYNSKTKNREQVLDPVAFASAFSKRAVVNWRNVTYRRLAKLVPIDLKLIPTEDLDKEIQFTQENMQALLENAYELDSFLQESAINIAIFRPDLGEELKNLNASQSGASTPPIQTASSASQSTQEG